MQYTAQKIEIQKTLPQYGIQNPLAGINLDKIKKRCD
jgi:hypothetical protein